jgi:hypothetical protein
MWIIIIQRNSTCHCNMALCTMSFKCSRQHAMLYLILGIVHSSAVADYHFNIEHEKRIAGHSTNIALHIVPSTLHCAIECASQHTEQKESIACCLIHLKDIVQNPILQWHVLFVWLIIVYMAYRPSSWATIYIYNMLIQ